MIATNGTFQTAVDGIWALGDINGRGAFTHTSYQDAEILIDSLSGGSRTADGRIPTYAMFTDPPLGRVGVSEREARQSGTRVLMATFPMSEHTRAMLDGETAGMIKLLVDADTDRFLGAATLGMAGDEIIQVISALMHAGASCQSAWRDAADPSDGRRVLPDDPATAATADLTGIRATSGRRIRQSDRWDFDVAAEDAAKRRHHFAQRGVGRDGVDQRGHQVDLGVGGLGSEAGEGGLDRVTVADMADQLEPLELTGFILVGDLQQIDGAFIVAFGERR